MKLLLSISFKIKGIDYVIYFIWNTVLSTCTVITVCVVYMITTNCNKGLFNPLINISVKIIGRIRIQRCVSWWFIRWITITCKIYDDGVLYSIVQKYFCSYEYRKTWKILKKRGNWTIKSFICTLSFCGCGNRISVLHGMQHYATPLTTASNPLQITTMMTAQNPAFHLPHPIGSRRHSRVKKLQQQEECHYRRIDARFPKLWWIKVTNLINFPKKTNKQCTQALQKIRQTGKYAYKAKMQTSKQIDQQSRMSWISKTAQNVHCTTCKKIHL